MINGKEVKPYEEMLSHTEEHLDDIERAIHRLESLLGPCSGIAAVPYEDRQRVIEKIASAIGSLKRLGRHYIKKEEGSPIVRKIKALIDDLEEEREALLLEEIRS